MTDLVEFDRRNEVPVSSQNLNLRAVFQRYLYHWPVFILSFLICIASAFLYLRYTKPIYSVNAVLLIKDDKKSGIPAGGDLLNELDLFGTSKIVDNEIEIIKSKTLMKKVVDRLNLSISFNAKGRVNTSDLYAETPFRVGIVEMNRKWFGSSLSFRLIGENRYEMEHVESSTKVRGSLNQLQRNTFGVYTISLKSNQQSLNTGNISITISDPWEVVDNTLRQLTVSLANKQASVLNLSIQSTIPERGQDILNTLIQVYNEAALFDKNKTTQSTIEFIDERLALLTGELTDVEKDVESFKSSRGLTDLSNDANIFLENVKVNDAKLSEINLKISVMRDIQKYIDSSEPNERIPSLLGVDDPVLLGQITELSELQLQRDRLLATTTKNNPLLEPIHRQVETTRAGIKTAVNNILKTLEVSKRDLQGNGIKYEGSIKKIPGQERQLVSIKRQQTIKESLYLYLLEKKEEAALSYASAVADSRIVDPAFYAKIPVSPKKPIVLLSSLILSLVLPISYIHAKSLMNNKIEGIEDVKHITNTPVLGEVMLDDNLSPIVVEPNSRSAISEQFRAIRTNLQFMRGKTPIKSKITLLTSSMSGEGKTFVATNLALAMALGGRKTVLLELDLRKPKVSKYLSLANNIGFSNYLIGAASLESIIQSTSLHENLYVIGSGPIPPNPSELLLQEDLKLMFDYLRANFDEIIIDTAPIGLVADAQILSNIADTTLFIVRQNITFKEQVGLLDSLYRNDKFRNLSVVVNGVARGGRYGYDYGYGYGGYGSGYYSDDKMGRQVSARGIINELIKRF